MQKKEGKLSLISVIVVIISSILIVGAVSLNNSLNQTINNTVETPPDTPSDNLTQTSTTQQGGLASLKMVTWKNPLIMNLCRTTL